MNQDLQNYRKSYEKGELNQSIVCDNPIEQFQQWFKETEASETVAEINAMTLSTMGTDGFPRGRVVLLKEITSEGFIFYTNYTSEKGISIEAFPHVCISFYWGIMERQISVKGIAEKISEEKSTAYFHSRPRKSQLGALVSEQSSPVESRNVLENRLAELEVAYEGKEIPKPSHWGGYLIRPTAFEFWQGRRSRLHDRIQYIQEGKEWKIQRLQP
ncbi:pyridoxamine 5'-phosphate oxidase [Cochleicola gelatinilyticus]|uniref:Pyridoxine/pyridoxamine 5'-phosphate oxidase n=1 Tax=Cochleicola gelatinilyticus TaxID=1763537 RepID=A0A167HU25_9FLAO|nr:pyridoxamine 5'-phosphate oxidase [Cochleicola gelatinilyticus]OAB78962.1 pyridoxamine 5'-phosphate oxidase [Cochleicola gelatinilyticus]